MKIVTVQVSLLLFAFSIVSIAAPSLSNANPLNDWNVSCGVDSGSYEKNGKTHVFRTSSNHCVGGTFKQRSEIFTRNVAPNHKGAYQFSSKVSFTSPSSDEFSIFQIHDGRNGCAPPFKLNVEPNGRLSLEGAYKVGSQPGNNCVQIASYSGKYSNAKIRRDGSEHMLNVTIAFDGNGGFRFWVSLDGAPQISGAYEPPSSGKFFAAERYYFKHGIYSYRVFPYVLTSTDLKVKRVRVK